LIKVFFVLVPASTNGSGETGLVGIPRQDPDPLCIGDATKRKPGARPGLCLMPGCRHDQKIS